MNAHRQTVELALLAGLFAMSPSPAYAKPPQLSSKGTGGAFANQGCISSLISGDGRYVAFETYATNISPDDTSNFRTVFLRDHEKGTTEVVSLRDDDSPIEGHSILESISKNGRYVLFLVAELGVDPNALSASTQAYLRDTKLGTTRNVSLDVEGNAVGNTVYSASMSPNARYIVFATRAPFVVDGVASDKDQVYLFDRSENTVELISSNLMGAPATGNCERPQVSANGRYVFFTTNSAGMTADDTNAEWDVFVRDRATGTTHLVSKGESGAIPEGSRAYAISASGKRVAFTSDGAVLDGVLVHDGLYITDWKSGALQPAFSSPSHHTISDVNVSGISLSADGKRLVVATEDNLMPSQSGAIDDVYFVSLDTGKAQLVTRAAGGGSADADTYQCAISADGRYVSYTSVATNLLQPGPPADVDQVYRQRL
jgi:Tol biopolymer transport system component